jgi:multidrug efflux pump subunit AcrB
MREGIIAASLTAVMILLFLGSWRSTLVVATSIPLSICFSVLALHVIGQTINIMTLGGLALAVGILVDDATVEIENIHRNLAMGKSMIDAILDGAQEIATPAFAATLSICIVFVPIFLLGGVAYYLFAPLAMAVVFAMLASYFLSRTVVPTMVNFLLKNQHQKENANELRPRHRNCFLRIHQGFNRGFEKLRSFRWSAVIQRITRSLRSSVRESRRCLISLAGSGQTAPNFWLNPQKESATPSWFRPRKT